MDKRAYKSAVMIIDNKAIFQNKSRASRYTSFNENEVSDLRVISDIRENAIRFAKLAGVKTNDLADIQIALGEALANAIKHGSPVMGVSRIGLGCHIVDGNFVAIISDEGNPFDERTVPDPAFDTCPECGLGIYLMRQVMDNVEFTHSSCGNQVKLVKKLATTV